MTWRRTLACLASAIVLGIGAVPAQAAAPANDNFSASTPLGVGQEIAGSNLEATAEPGEPDFSASVAPPCQHAAEGPECTHSVWFTFQTAQAGKYTIETCDASDEVDTVMGIFTGAALAALTKVSEDDDGEGGDCAGAQSFFGSRLTIEAEAGTPYRIGIAGFFGDEGFFYIRAYAGEPQPRPLPDTEIVRTASYLSALRRTRGIVSGPRRLGAFPLISTAPGASFECSLDGAPYAACSPPIAYEGLAEGTTHFFQARAVAAGAVDPTPARESFTIDTAPPETTLSGPSGPFGSQTATWMAGSSQRSTAGNVGCQLDALVGTCGPSTTFSELCQGPHSFTATAIDPAGNADPSPATDSVGVSVGPACAAPTVGATTKTTVEETSARIDIPFRDNGAGATLRVVYGPTAGYGMEINPVPISPIELTPEEEAEEEGPELGPTLPYLDPGTLYHYMAILTTPFGTASTADQTLTTHPAGGPLPTMLYGTPAPGRYTAALPVSIDAKGVPTFFSLLIDTKSPVTSASPTIAGRPSIPAGTVGGQAVVSQVVDLEPGTVYHYRFAVAQFGEETRNEVLGPEGSFTTLPPATAAAAKSRFKLRKRMVKLGKITRDMRFLKVRVRELPPKTTVSVKFFVGKKHVKARKKAKANGRVKFKIRLAKKIRRALHDETLKKVKIKVTAKPPGEPASSVTFKKRLKS